MESAEKNVEQEFIEKTHTFKYPELDVLFTDVQKIQEGKEQVQFIVQEIQKIRSKYQDEAQDLIPN
jgi:hypothetical protein